MTAGGPLLVFCVMLPAVGLLLCLLLGGRQGARITLLCLAVGAVLALAIATGVLRADAPLVYHLGGWAPPLGVALRADGISAVMLLTTVVVMGGVALFARGVDAPGSRRGFAFWPLLLALWSALNLVFLGNDLFNIFVGLELLTFAAVPLVCLDGRAETLSAALRYLIFALFGSVLYLLGVALLYGAYGTLDLQLLAAGMRPDTATLAAGALMTAGLLAKTALFPLHLWLPPAHAGAPPAASAVLSALVVKASFFVVLRIWFGLMPGLLTGLAPQILAAMGSLAILYGSAVALRQARLKLLVAYSTVAQIGYLFFMFPLVAAATGDAAAAAWTGGMLQAVSHALAKAAMFLAAGLIAEALGHDRLREMGGVARALPVTMIAFGLGGMSLMGLPPSGGFTAKWLLLQAAIATGQWWWAAVMLGGGLLTGGYVFHVLAMSLRAAPRGLVLARVARGREAVVLALALASIVLGLLPLASFGLVQIGRLP